MKILTSVIIASHNAETVISTCLTRLEQQGDSSILQIIVADSSTDSTPELVEKLFPSVQLLRFNEPLPLPELRGHGIAQAKGCIIAILDPYSMVAPDWLEQLTRAHTQRKHPVIGGTVDLFEAEQCGLLVWAQYISEYGMFMSPLNAGEIEILPGSNISYKREALFDGERPRFGVFWKTFVNAELEQPGTGLWQAPDIKVALWKPVRFGSFFLTRFAHGRCYAGMRCANSGILLRFLRLLSTLIVPFLLQYRWGKRYWSKNSYRGKFILTLPLQFILFVCWSAGEFTGYLAGPGKCCGKLYY
jgi:glycosyltransferase involved in cell wall biosynthesis